MPWQVNEVNFEDSVKVSWDGVNQSDFETEEAFFEAHSLWKETADSPADLAGDEDVALPIAQPGENGDLELVHEALQSAYDFASNVEDIEQETVDEVRDYLQSLQEEYFPEEAEENPLDEGEPEEDSMEIDSMNPEEKEERVSNIKENQEQIKTADLKVTGKDVEVVDKDSDDGNGEVVVNVPIQALSEDRDGDFINEKGQESIVQQLKSGTVPLMLNHGVSSNDALYDARDIVGQFVDGDSQDGTTIGTARMRKSKDGEELHKDAKEVVDLLEQDMPIGFSVGFIPQEVDEKENGGMEISDLDLMEVSAVGIPSNPDAVPQAMSSAVAMAKNAGMEDQEIMETIEKAFNDTMSKNKEQSEKDVKDGGEPEQVLTDKDLQKLKQTFKDAIIEHKTRQVQEKAEGDVTEEDVADFAQSHFDGMNVADFMDAVDDAGGEYVGQLDLREVATLLATRFDMDTGNVLSALEELAEMETNQPEDDDNEDEAENEDEDEQENVEENSASDHIEDEKSLSSESADNESEEKQELSDEEKTVDETGTDGRKMNELDSSKSEGSKEEKSEEKDDPAKVEQPADYWG